jgi:hypothetical protein
MAKPQKSNNTLFIFIIICLILVFLFLTLGNIVLKQYSITFDEKSHYKYGDIIYHLKTNRFDDSKMPVSVLNVIPVKIAENLFHVTFTKQAQRVKLGRISTVLISLLLAYLCYKWTSSLYGVWVGLVGFGLYIFEPNIIAHSQLVTTDIYSAASTTLFLYGCWRFFESPDFKRGILLGLALGLAQISKYSCILLYPMVLLFALIRYAGWLRIQFMQKSWKNICSAFWILIKYGILILISSLFVINLGFFFNRFGTPLSGYPFTSDFFKSLQNFPFLAKIPLPLPYPYLEGLDAVMFRERTGGGHGPIYLLGKLSGNGFPAYYIVASFFKVPISILALLCLSLWDWVRSFRMEEFVNRDMYLIIPALIYSVYFNFLYKAQIGIRFLLIIFPILIIFSTRIFRHWKNFSRGARIIAGLAGCYLIISVVSYYPNYISYFNEFVLNRTNAYQYLADSNLDWGQNAEKMAKFLKAHPDYHFNPSEPTDGIIVVGTNEYLGISRSPQAYQWLRDNFKPVGSFLQTYLIFDISPSDIAGIK